MHADGVAGIAGGVFESVIRQNSLQWDDPACRWGAGAVAIDHFSEFSMRALGLGRTDVGIGGAAEDVEAEVELLRRDLVAVIVCGEGVASVREHDRKGIVQRVMCLNKRGGIGGGFVRQQIHAQQTAGAQGNLRELIAIHAPVEDADRQAVFIDA